jgi:hypothetical protein
MLADKVSGNMLGLWLLVPEHLRLGTWDVLCRWAQQSTERLVMYSAYHSNLLPQVFTEVPVNRISVEDAT